MDCNAKGDIGDQSLINGVLYGQTHEYVCFIGITLNYCCGNKASKQDQCDSYIFWAHDVHWLL